MNTALVVGGAALTAGAAQISIPMWPVPITGQTFAVLLVGTTLGMWRGALSMVLYIALGAMGLPVFTGAQGGLDSLIGGPTVGYILGFVLAGALTGWLAERGLDRSVWGAVAIFAVGEAVIYAVGLPVLSSFLSSIGAPHDVAATLAAGFVPFVIGDVLKAVLAGALLPLTWKLVNKKS
jgi:biotin transport system substrate-specific component